MEQNRSRGSRDAVALLALLAGALGLYLPLAGIPPYGDDYLLLSENPPRAMYEYFIAYHEMGGVFRPLQMTWSALNQVLFGERTFVLHAGQALMHALLASVLLRFLRAAGVGAWPGFLAASVFVVHSTSVSAVLGNDTASQVGSTLLAFLSFALAWSSGCAVHDAVPGTNTPRGRAAGVLSALAFAAALLFKETALSYLPIVMLTAVYHIWRCRRSNAMAAGRRFVVLLVVYAAITGLYFIFRGQLTLTRVAFSPSGDYSFWIGPNVLVNQVLLFLGALLPYSTADTFVAFRRHSLLTLAGIGILLATWLGLIGRGLLLARAGWATLALLCAASCATVPMTLMNHVSELYTYNMAPFLTILLALALAALLNRRRPVRRRVVAVSILVVVLASNVIGVTRKAAQMRRNGEAAASLAAQVVEQARQLPPNGRILLVERPRAGEVRYSVFLTSEFQGLAVAERWIRHLAGRPDIALQVVDEGHASAADKMFVRDDTSGSPRLKEWTPARAADRL